MRNVLLTLAVEYALGALGMLAMMVKGRPWAIVGWSRRKRLWVGAWETTVNVLLWPVPCAQVLWSELG